MMIETLLKTLLPAGVLETACVKSFDLSNPEDYDEIVKRIEELRSNILVKLICNNDEKEVNKFVDGLLEDVRKVSDALSAENADNDPEDGDEEDFDDPIGIVEAYLDETAKGWRDQSEEEQEKYVNVLCNFYEWLMDNIDFIEEDEDTEE